MADKTVADRSPDSAAMVPYWDLTDDILAGADRMKEQGKKYIPMFPNEEKTSYEFRLEYTKFTNIFRDISEALASKPFEEETKVANNTIPEQIASFVEDVDGSGNNLTVFASQVFFNGIVSAIDWIFIDYPNTNGRNIRTRADEQRAGIRPFWSHVLGRNILEAKSAIVEGKEEYVLIRIWEPGSPNHVRVMKKENGIASWKVYEERFVRAVKEYVEIEAGVFTVGVIPMVPFATGRRDGKRYFYYPAMRDAADLQKVLYRGESQLEYASVMTAHPMLTGNGVRPDKDDAGNIKPIAVGPHAALYAPPDGNGDSGSWSWIEPAATSLDFLLKKNEATIQQLRELGRQPLTAQSGQLTVITTMFAAGKAKSAVQAWANLLKDALENALVITSRYYNIAFDPEVRVYNEFDDYNDSQQDTATLTDMRKNGDLSLKTYHEEMQRRRVLSAEFTHERELERILEEVPSDDTEDKIAASGGETEDD